MPVDPYGEERKQSLEAYEARRRASVRAGDADRERTVQQLQQHLADGRLDYEEFNERVDEAYAARTMDDLADALRELPRIPAQPRPNSSPVAAPRRGMPVPDNVKARKTALAVNVAAYVVVNTFLVLIWLVNAVSDGPVFFWPMFSLFFWGVSIVAQTVEIRRNR